MVLIIYIYNIGSDIGKLTLYSYIGDNFMKLWESKGNFGDR